MVFINWNFRIWFSKNLSVSIREHIDWVSKDLRFLEASTSNFKLHSNRCTAAISLVETSFKYFTKICLRMYNTRRINLSIIYWIWNSQISWNSRQFKCIFRTHFLFETSSYLFTKRCGHNTKRILLFRGPFREINKLTMLKTHNFLQCPKCFSRTFICGWRNMSIDLTLYFTNLAAYSCAVSNRRHSIIVYECLLSILLRTATKTKANAKTLSKGSHNNHSVNIFILRIWNQFLFHAKIDEFFSIVLKDQEPTKILSFLGNIFLFLHFIWKIPINIIEWLSRCQGPP